MDYVDWESFKNEIDRIEKISGDVIVSEQDDVCIALSGTYEDVKSIFDTKAEDGKNYIFEATKMNKKEYRIEYLFAYQWDGPIRSSTLESFLLSMYTEDQK